MAAQTTANIDATELLLGFSQLPQTAAGRQVLTQNLETAISINNNATPAQRAQAIKDNTIALLVGSMSNGLATADGLGPAAYGVFATKNSVTQAYASTALSTNFKNLFTQITTLAVGGDSAFAKNFFANGSTNGNPSSPATGISLPAGGVYNVYDLAYSPAAANANTVGDSRPVQVAPSRIQTFTGTDFFGNPVNTAIDIIPTLKSNASFPSGHSAFGITSSLLLAMMVPERYQELLTRGSEYAYSRVVLGAHYPLDVIGARIQTYYAVAQILNNNADYLNKTIPGLLGGTTTTTGDFATLFANATADLRSLLAAGCGTDIATCTSSANSANAGDRFANGTVNKANFTSQLTFGLPAVGAANLAAVVPQGAEVLIANRFPYLSAAQRRDVLATTELPSGYALDDGTGWARLNLYAAADGYGALTGDTAITMDAALGGFNASDTWNNDITGTGRLIKQGTGSLTLTGSNSFGGIRVTGGTLALTGINHFSGASRVDAGGTLAMAVDGTTPGQGAGHYAQIVGGGSASFVAGGTLRPVMGNELTTTSGYRNPAIGTRYTLVSTAADNGVSGRFSALTVNSATQALLLPNTTFDIAYYPNAITVTVAPVSYASAAATGVALTGNQAGVASAIDRIRAATGNGLSAADGTSVLLGAVGGLGSGRLAAGLTQMSGVGSLNTAAQTLDAGRSMTRTLSGRLDQIRTRGTTVAENASEGLFSFTVAQLSSSGTMVDSGGGPAAGAGRGAAASGLSGWVRGFGGVSLNDGTGDAPGFRATMAGGMTGVDYAVSPSVTVGGGIGYARGFVRGGDGAGESDSDNYQLALYGSWSDGSAFVDGLAGYTISRHETRRDLAVDTVNGRATGTVNGGAVSLGLRAGHGFRMDDTLVEPDAGLYYDHAYTRSYSETGAGAFNLTSDGTRVDSVRSRIGLRVLRTIGFDSGLQVEPEVRAHWEHEFADRDAHSTMTLAGQPFVVRGGETGRDAAVLGASVAGVADGAFRLFVSYDTALRSRQSDHLVTAGLKVNW